MNSAEEVLLYKVLEAMTDRIEQLERVVTTILTTLETHSHGYVGPPVYGGQ